MLQAFLCILMRKLLRYILESFFQQKCQLDFNECHVQLFLLLYRWVFLTFQVKAEVSWLNVNAFTDNAFTAMFLFSVKIEKWAVMLQLEQNIMICKL